MKDLRVAQNWTHFDYEDDDFELASKRLREATKVKLYHDSRGNTYFDGGWQEIGSDARLGEFSRRHAIRPKS